MRNTGTGPATVAEAEEEEAEAEGGGGGGMTAGTLTTFVTADFSGSATVPFCHSALTDGSGAEVSIDTHWRSTMMGNASKDPLWQAKITSEVIRNPELSGVIEEKCSRCHTPWPAFRPLRTGCPWNCSEKQLRRDGPLVMGIGVGARWG